MWSSLVRVCCLIAALGMLHACATDQSSGEFETLSIPDATTSVAAGDLRIGQMDTLSVTVFGVGELDGVYQVDFDGKIRLPLIGEVNAFGKTPGELAIELENLYEANFLQDPNVNVSIVESVGRRITLDGSINSPGQVPITGSVTLLQAVALGGGPTEGANPRRVVVFRQINGERHSASFDLVAIRNGNAEDPEIYGNDIIVVDGSEARRTYGELLQSLPLIALFLAF